MWNSWWCTILRYIIDDFLRKLLCFALKSKDQGFETFKSFYASVERETRRKRKRICVDNNGEHLSQFEQYCHDHGIRLEWSVPKTHQHNSVVGRMNRMICEQIRCVISRSKLPKPFWDETMRIAVDLINLSSSATLDSDVLERVCWGKDVSLNHLTVLGYRVYVHMPKDGRSNLDDHEEFGHRLYEPMNKRVIRSKDLVFLED